MGPTWPHVFLLVCKAKNARNGISIKHIDLVIISVNPFFFFVFFLFFFCFFLFFFVLVSGLSGEHLRMS